MVTKQIYAISPVEGYSPILEPPLKKVIEELPRIEEWKRDGKGR